MALPSLSPLEVISVRRSNARLPTPSKNIGPTDNCVRQRTSKWSHSHKGEPLHPKVSSLSATQVYRVQMECQISDQNAILGPPETNLNLRSASSSRAVQRAIRPQGQNTIFVEYSELSYCVRSFTPHAVNDCGWSGRAFSPTARSKKPFEPGAGHTYRT